MAKPLTKVELLARIDALEREVAALYQQQRPSRLPSVGREVVTSRPDNNTEVRRFTGKDGRRWEKTITRMGARVVTKMHEVTS